MTLGEIKTQVYRLLRDPSRTRFSEPIVTQWINIGEQIICTKLELYTKVDTSITTQAGVNEYNLPSDYATDIAVFLDDTQLTEVDIQDSQKDSSVTPSYYYIKNGVTIGLYGTVSAGQTLKIVYNSKGGTMSDNNDEPIIPEQYHIALVFYAAYMCALEGDDDRRTEFYNNFVQMLNLMGAKIVEDRYGDKYPVIGEEQTDIIYNDPFTDNFTFGG